MFSGDIAELYKMAWKYVNLYLNKVDYETRGDLVQEIVLKAWKAWNYDEKRNKTRFAYFSIIAYSAVANVAKREKWSENRNAKEFEAFTGMGAGQIHYNKYDLAQTNCIARDYTPENSAVLIRMILRNIDLTLYKIAMLRAYGYNDNEIAKRTGMKNGAAVRAYVQKMRRRLGGAEND